MIKILNNLDNYMEFIYSFMMDEQFSDPMLKTDEQVQLNLLNSVNRTNNIVLGTFDEKNIITGLFVFLVEEEESYAEMIVGLSKNKVSYLEMFSYLEANFSGINCDFVYNPRNYLLNDELKKRNALFEVEQQKLKLTNIIPYQSDLRIEYLSEEYYAEYKAIHNKDMYWTGERIIEAKSRFKTLIAIDNDNIVGYIDFTYCFDENEPFDLLVLPEYRGQKYGKSLLARAIEINHPKRMMLLVDIDNGIAINLYKSLGFSAVIGENNLTAHLLIK